MSSALERIFKGMGKKSSDIGNLSSVLDKAEKGTLHLDEKGIKKMCKRFGELAAKDKKKLFSSRNQYVTPVTLEQIPHWQQAGPALINDTPGKPAASCYKVDTALNKKVVLWYGDISQLEVDVVVNATATAIMNVRHGVSKAICERAGPLIEIEMEAISRIKIGHMAVTAGYALPSRYIYHTSGPEWRATAEVYLRKCYLNCLDKMKEMGLRTLAFSCISTGAKGMPKKSAAKFALQTTRDWLQENSQSVDTIVFSVFDDKKNWEVYKEMMPLVFPLSSVDITLTDSTSRETTPTLTDSTSRETTPPGTPPSSMLPIEILRMDKKSIDLYKQALTDGKEAVHNIRVMVVGHYGVGKTALTRRLLGKKVDITARNSTNGIKVHIRRCKVSQDGQWTMLQKDEKSENNIKRMAKLLMSQQKLNQGTDMQAESTGCDEVAGNFDDVDGCRSCEDGQPEDMDEVDGFHGNSVESDADVVKVSTESDIKVDGHSDEENDITEMESTLKHDLQELIREVNKTDLQEEEDLTDLSIWDFAGQYAFYATHQVFLSPRAVYLLVTDISQHINDVVKEDECFFDCSGSKPCKVSEFIEFWLRSIHGYCPSVKTGVPPVILVGTHADQLDQTTRKQLSDSYFEALRNLLVNKPTYYHLADEDFAVDNTIIDTTLDGLKKKILEIASQQDYWGEMIPARWIMLEKALVELKDKGLKIIERKAVEDLSKAMPVPLGSDEELKLFLKFQHDYGNILYFSDEDLQDNILLDPQWLMDAFKCLITAEKFRKNTQIHGKWREFSTRAILKWDLINAVWKQEENENKFFQHRDHLIGLLERLDIIAKPRTFSEDLSYTKVENYFFAPCVLKDKPPSTVLTSSQLNCSVTTTKLCFTVSTKFIPAAIFNRLLASCLTQWPIATQTEKSQIYCGCGIFDVDQVHRLTLYFNQNIIHLWVTKYGLKHPEPSIDVCTRVREFIENTLKRINGQLCQSSEIEIYLKCPHVDAESSRGLLKLDDFFESDEVPCHDCADTHVLTASEMLQFWYEKNESQVDDEDPSHSCLLFQTLERVPNDQEIAKMSRKIGKEYHQLALELGLDQAVTEQIVIENHLVADRVVHILQNWKSKRTRKATFRELERAMQEVNIDARHVFEDIQ